MNQILSPTKIDNSIQSFYEYKGYTVRLRFIKGLRLSGNASYSIIKYIDNINSPNGKKALYLKQENWTYCLPEKLLERAKNYIDNHEDNLIKKFKIKADKSSAPS